MELLISQPTVTSMSQPSSSIHLPRPLRPYSIQSLHPRPLAQDTPHPPSLHVPSSSSLSRQPTTHPSPRFPFPSLPSVHGPSLSPLPPLPRRRDSHFSFLSHPATPFSHSLHFPRYPPTRSRSACSPPSPYKPSETLSHSLLRSLPSPFW